MKKLLAFYKTSIQNQINTNKPKFVKSANLCDLNTKDKNSIIKFATSSQRNNQLKNKVIELLKAKREHSKDDRSRRKEYSGKESSQSK
jgi:hypothetical protein